MLFFVLTSNVGKILMLILVSLFFGVRLEYLIFNFKSNIFSIYVELQLQVQVDVGAKRFNDSYDCIGFTSAPIWSGVFVSFIICFVVAFALNSIMGIHAPNRFENSRGKPLSFTISE